MDDLPESTDRTAPIRPFSRSRRMDNESASVDKRITECDSRFFIRLFAVSALLASAIETVGPPPLIKPNTKMNTRGKPKLKATEAGFLKMDFKLPFVIASMALSWLYFSAIQRRSE